MAIDSALVLIPSYNHFDFVLRCVSSLHKRDVAPNIKLEYVIIDDASPEWPSIDWNCFPNPSCQKINFSEQAGLTRSWNEGLRVAREVGYTYTVCTNSDVLFAPNSLAALFSALNSDMVLAGPLSNAPGNCTWQKVLPFLGGSRERISIDDSYESLVRVAAALKSLNTSPIACPINGFCMAARTEHWWQGAFSDQHVFDPAFPLEHNEFELQRRWRSRRYSIGMVPQSYVFHYRSVSRPEGLRGDIALGAVRPIC